MIAVDTSLLAWAVNRHRPEHARAAAAVDALANGAVSWALPWPAAHEFLRLVTHAHAAPRPLAPREAAGYLTTLLESPSVVPIGPTRRHADVVAELLHELPPGSALPPALELVAVLREHGVREVLSADPSLRRFAFLSVIDPIHGPPWSPAAAPVRRYRRLRGRGAAVRP